MWSETVLCVWLRLFPWESNEKPVLNKTKKKKKMYSGILMLNLFIFLENWLGFVLSHIQFVSNWIGFYNESLDPVHKLVAFTKFSQNASSNPYLVITNDCKGHENQLAYSELWLENVAFYKLVSEK